MNLSGQENLRIELVSSSSGTVTLSLKTQANATLGEIQIEERKLIPLSHALHHFFKERATSAAQVGKYRATVRLSSDTMEIEFE